MTQRTIFFGLVFFFVSTVLSLAFQREVRADPPSSDDERTLGEWLEKKIDWRPLGLHTYWENGFRIDSPKESIKIKIDGSMMIDVGTIDAQSELRTAFPNFEGGEIDLRRLRLSGLATLHDTVDLRLDIEFADVREIKDNWIGLTKRVPIFGYVKVGHMKEPFSIEELINGTDLTFVERSLPTVAFAPGRNLGILFHNAVLGDRMTWALGGFWNTGSLRVGEAKDRITDPNGCDLSARITGLLWYEDAGRSLLHLGFAYSHQSRDKNSSNGAVAYRTWPESKLTNDTLVDTGELVTNRAELINAELAWVQGPFSLQSEYFHTFTGATEGGNLRFWGLYLQASYFLTGECRSYNTSTGVFSQIKPKNFFHPLKGKWGSWEIAVRLSYLDLNDRNIKGGKESNLTAGLNWYLNPNLRLMFNYIRVHVEDRNTSPSLSNGYANTFQARLQFAF
jgi:phosphate-selective porin OprO/OprP